MAIRLQRKAYEKLLKWKAESQGKSAVLIEGARRVGKTYLIRDFVSREYRSHVCKLTKTGSWIDKSGQFRSIHFPPGAWLRPPQAS